MQVAIHNSRLELIQGDITQVAADAIVNAANSRLAGGGGVDGAIHRVGGPQIMEETKRQYPQGCPTGSAVISGAGRLNARFVIHAVGPVWQGGNEGEESLLARAYQTSLQLACEHECESIAMPALSTGAYGYPLDRASRTALRTTMEILQTGGSLTHVWFVLFGAGAYGSFAAAMEELVHEMGDPH